MVGVNEMIKFVFVLFLLRLSASNASMEFDTRISTLVISLWRCFCEIIFKDRHWRYTQRFHNDPLWIFDFYNFEKYVKLLLTRLRLILTSEKSTELFILLDTEVPKRSFVNIRFLRFQKTCKATFDKIKANLNSGKIDRVIYITRHRGSGTILCEYSIFTISKNM